MEDPTVYELLRSLASRLDRLEAEQRELRASVTPTRELDLRFLALEKDQQEDRTRVDKIMHWWGTVFVGPLLVGVLLYFLLRGES